MELRRANKAKRPSLEPWDAIGFGVEVRRLRRARRLKQRELVEAMYGAGSKGIAGAWGLENGMRGTCPGPGMLRSLAGLLGVPEAHLLRAAGYAVACPCGRCPRLDRSEAARARMREAAGLAGRGDGEA